MVEQQGVSRFEDLKTWQIARELSKSVYVLTRDGAMRKDFSFRDQIRRAAVSVMNNIAEGFERGSNKEFVRFLFIAKGSAGEVRSMLYIAKDLDYISEDEFQRLGDLCVQSSKTIWGLLKSLRGKSDWITGLKILLGGWALNIGLTQW